MSSNYIILLYETIKQTITLKSPSACTVSLTTKHVTRVVWILQIELHLLEGFAYRFHWKLEG